MNRTIITLALMALCLSVSAAKKDKKKAQTEAVVEVVAEQKSVVELYSMADSVSYAAGQAHTQGMAEYVKQQYNVSDEDMPFFMEGLKKGLAMSDDAQTKARAAGEQIAAMVRNRMLPNLTSQLEGTSAPVNVELFKRGFLDAVEQDNSILSVAEAAKYFESKQPQMRDEKIAAQKAEGQQFLAENATKEGVKVTPSGLQYKVLVEGNGPVATSDQEVVVRYEGKLINGTVFDSSYMRKPDTTSFRPTQVIKGWTEALCMMPQGSTWELYIPYDLAYGEYGQGAQIPPYATLIFKVEVVEVKK